MNTFAPVSDLLTGIGCENWPFAPDFVVFAKFCILDWKTPNYYEIQS